MAKKAKLGQSLLDMVDEITLLLGKATNPDSVQKLVVQQLTIRKQLAELIDKNLDQASKKYKDATAGVKEASTSIKKALDDMEAVVNTINTSTSRSRRL